MPRGDVSHAKSSAGPALGPGARARGEEGGWRVAVWLGEEKMRMEREVSAAEGEDEAGLRGLGFDIWKGGEGAEEPEGPSSTSSEKEEGQGRFLETWSGGLGCKEHVASLAWRDVKNPGEFRCRIAGRELGFGIDKGLLRAKVVPAYGRCCRAACALSWPEVARGGERRLGMKFMWDIMSMLLNVDVVDVVDVFGDEAICLAIVWLSFVKTRE